MSGKNPYEAALDAVWEAHDCNPVGRVTAGDLHGACASVSVCGDEACRSIGTAYVTASGLTPVEFVPFRKDDTPVGTYDPNQASLFDTEVSP